jgi:hypothetical protein
MLRLTCWRLPNRDKPIIKQRVGSLQLEILDLAENLAQNKHASLFYRQWKKEKDLSSWTWLADDHHGSSGTNVIKLFCP